MTTPSLVATAWLALAAPVAPPPPATYDVELRYDIRAGRAQRLAEFDRMVRRLEAAEFKLAPDEENDGSDADAERLRGTVPSANAPRLLDDPAVQTLLLTPAGWKRPDDPAARVPVSLTLYGPLARRRQRELWEQARERLAGIGFQEYVGADDRGGTRLRGSVPVAEIDTLLRDLRGQPAGWLAPEVPYDALPEPIRRLTPVRVVEVTPEPEGAPPAGPPPVAAGPPSKVTPELAAALAAEGAAAKPVRVQMILADEPTEADGRWREALARSAPGLVVEGRVGPVVTAVLPAESVPALAEVPAVSTVRLPVAADTAAAVVPTPPAGFDPLAASRTAQLHQLGRRGAGVRVVVVDSDFAGLPASAGLLDLTAARREDAEPDPTPGTGTGRGTLVYRAVRAAAPAAAVTPVRIDPAAAYHLLAVARYSQKRPVEPDDLLARVRQLGREAEDLAERRAVLLRRRTELLEAFEGDEEGLKRRAEVNKQLADLDKEEAAHVRRTENIRALREGLAGLAGADVLVCPLVWNTGYPLDGGSSLAMFLHDTLTPPLPWVRVGGLRPTPKLLWFQAAGDTAAQAWAGPFRDEDNDGVLEFAPFGTPLPAGRWTPQLNFVGFDPAGGDAPAAEVPEGARLRVTVQWSEAHDPDVTYLPDDPYRLPLADLRPVLLRQRDPSGKQLPSDDLEVAGRSVAAPVRLSRSANLATYEQSVEVPAAAAGRYALRVEGRAPAGLVPPGVTRLPSDLRSSELRLRVFVEVIDAGTRAKGRPVFLDAASPAGGVGVPGDGHAVVVIGAARPDGTPERFAAAGAGPITELLPRPHLIAYDRLTPDGGRVGGTGVAAGFAAGTSASLLSGGVGPNFFLRWLGLPAGGLYVVPEPFLTPRE